METKTNNNLCLAQAVTPRSYYNSGFKWIDISANLEETAMGKLNMLLNSGVIDEDATIIADLM